VIVTPAGELCLDAADEIIAAACVAGRDKLSWPSDASASDDTAKAAQEANR
jgi:hypothetical protein